MKNLFQKLLIAVVSALLISIAWAEVVSVNVGGTASVDALEDPDNERFVVDIAALLGRSGTKVTVTGVSWDVNMTAAAPSLLWDMRVYLGGNFIGDYFIWAQPGFETLTSGTASFEDGFISADLGLLDIVLDDGLLKLEFYEENDDFDGLNDGIWNSGTLSFEVFPPSPGEFIGATVTEFGSPDILSLISDIAAQSNGKIVLAGRTIDFEDNEPNWDFIVYGYNADGSMDSSFGANGSRITDFNDNSQDRAYDVGIQSDGKIVLVGQSGTLASDIALARYTTTGELDSTFGFFGKVVTLNAGRDDIGLAIAIQPDDKIVVAGYSTDAMPQDDFMVLRYLPNGNLDTGFGINGIVTTPIANLTDDQATSVAIQPDGRIVVAGTSAGNFAVVRYTSTGALDPTFSGGGKLTTTIGESALQSGLVLQDDGKIVVSGSADFEDLTTVNCLLSNGTQCQFSDYVLVRYYGSGTLDDTFNGTGIVTTTINNRGNDDIARSVAIQPDGKIVVAGYSDTTDYDDFSMPMERDIDMSLARYNADGTLDTSFGTNGKVIHSLSPDSGDNERIGDIVLTENNNIFGAMTGGDVSNALVRFAGDFVPVPQTVRGDLSGDTKADILWRNTGSGQNYLYTMDGATITSSTSINTIADQNWVIAGTGDYNGDLKTDILWRNQVTGVNFMYLMNGASIMGAANVNILPNQNWQIVGNGDFNQDNKADILWRNMTTGQVYLYLMNGALIMSQSTVANVGLSWKIVGNVDYNGDGKADILWRNVLTGQNYLYEMNGATITRSDLINTVADQNWQIVGTGDHNGDKRADILWRNASTGQNYLYLMDGRSVTAALPVNTVADLNWKVAASGDYNGDGKADILWRNSFTGQNWLYQMNSNTITGSSQVNFVSDSNWKVISPN